MPIWVSWSWTRTGKKKTNLSRSPLLCRQVPPRVDDCQRQEGAGQDPGVRYKLLAQFLQRRFVVNNQLTESGKCRIARAVNHLMSSVEEAENGLAVVDSRQENQEPDVVLNLDRQFRNLSKIRDFNCIQKQESIPSAYKQQNWSTFVAYWLRRKINHARKPFLEYNQSFSSVFY